MNQEIKDVSQDPQGGIPGPEKTQETGFQARLQPLLSNQPALIVVIIATVGSLALLCLFAYLLTKSDEETDPTATPSEIIESVVDTDTFEYVAVSDSGVISVTMETPIFIRIGAEEFTVQAEVVPEDEPWDPEVPNETTAIWVYGSIINYVFGLDNTKDNKELLESMALGDEIILTSRSGASTTFTLSSRQSLSRANSDVIAQRSPAVTIILDSDDPEELRLVVKGRYAASDVKNVSLNEQVVELGETAQLEGLQITANSVSYQAGRVEVPDGFMFYTVDYQAQNVGIARVDSGQLNMVLIDDLGNQYALNPIAAQLGNYPMLNGTIEPGETSVATAGYQIPLGLNSRFLRWQVSRLDSGSQIQVNIPFAEQQAAARQANTQIQEATISEDGSSLIIVGQITNFGEQELIVDVGDLSLTSQGTVFLMLSVNPSFPWRVGAGQTIQFLVTFQRPLADTAVFTVLNQSFQLTGLR
ncbi:MAG: hypothetical protein WA996_24940 [Candidatus Promineifilaceae bacterium]